MSKPYLKAGAIVLLMDDEVIRNKEQRKQSGRGCEFPERWLGMWFQKGAHPAISIERRQLAFKGTCVETDGDMFLIEDREHF
ncbi:hypothetical protein IscW_ISCW015402 [Ixodes scapularis]|uniref:DUF7044 domain-containing protein n=1 Tax=Ixodes scapularis TaxID=6945 RepID=B7QNF3_IXOSC|nr:hypothetical protein IscW_ISCW015402 [Ixodes scapularis]|eukprot:XP_002416458.1 hypothetical protein IscW_ISCW015402 [Ixodes scapularis]